MVAPPSVLKLLVRNLDIVDGGAPIIGSAHPVEDREQAPKFGEHVRSGSRTLPIIALTTKPGSNYYGVDPDDLAETLSGLVQLSCVGSPILGEITKLLDPGIAPVAGAAQIYEPHSHAVTLKERRSSIRQSRRGGRESLDAGHMRRLLIQRSCALSAGQSVG